MLKPMQPKPPPVPVGQLDLEAPAVERAISVKMPQLWGEIDLQGRGVDRNQAEVEQVVDVCTHHEAAVRMVLAQVGIAVQVRRLEGR
jgi:hypothetical protein